MHQFGPIRFVPAMILVVLIVLAAPAARGQCTYEGAGGAHYQMLELSGENLMLVLFDTSDLCECANLAAPTETVLVYLLHPTATHVTAYEFHLDLPPDWSVLALELPPLAVNAGDQNDVKVTLPAPMILNSGLTLLARYTVQTTSGFSPILLGPAEPGEPDTTRPLLHTDLGPIPCSYPVAAQYLDGNKAWVATANDGQCGPVAELASIWAWGCVKSLYR